MLTTRPTLKIISSFVTSEFTRKIFKAPHINDSTLRHMKNDYISVFGSLLNCILYNGLANYKTLNIPKHVILFKDDSVLNYEIYQAYAKTDNLEIHTQCKGGHHETTQYWPKVATTLATLLK